MELDKILGYQDIGIPILRQRLINSCFPIFQKFVDEEQLIHQYFPDQFYALAFPLLAGVIGLALIGKIQCKKHYKILPMH